MSKQGEQEYRQCTSSLAICDKLIEQDRINMQEGQIFDWNRRKCLSWVILKNGNKIACSFIRDWKVLMCIGPQKVNTLRPCLVRFWGQK